MPTLPSDIQESASSAAQTGGGGDFKPLERGVYTARLAKVDAVRSRNDKPMWSMEYDNISDLDGKKMPGRLWSNITLEESTSWKIGQWYESFGVPTSTDTDLLINSRVRLNVIVEVQRFGKNAGKEVNSIDRYQALEPADEGYERAQTLKAKLAGKKAPAAVQARTQIGNTPAEEPGLMPLDESDVDF